MLFDKARTEFNKIKVVKKLYYKKQDDIELECNVCNINEDGFCGLCGRKIDKTHWSKCVKREDSVLELVNNAQ